MGLRGHRSARGVMRSRRDGVLWRMIPLAAIALLLAFIWGVSFNDEGASHDAAMDSEGDNVLVSSDALEEGGAGIGGDRTRMLSAGEGAGVASGQEGAVAAQAPEIGFGSGASSGQELDEVIINSSVTGVNTSAGSGEAPASDLVGTIVRPATGHIFVSTAQGSIPQLAVTAPDGMDAFVKIRRASTGADVVVFYVRANTTVRVCVPPERCVLYYALGSDWLGEQEVFGDSSIYAASDRELDFTRSTNSYAYLIGTENSNIDPIPIAKEDFV